MRGVTGSGGYQKKQLDSLIKQPKKKQKTSSVSSVSVMVSSVSPVSVMVSSVSPVSVMVSAIGGTPEERYWCNLSTPVDAFKLSEALEYVLNEKSRKLSDEDISILSDFVFRDPRLHNNDSEDSLKYSQKKALDNICSCFPGG